MAKKAGSRPGSKGVNASSDRPKKIVVIEERTSPAVVAALIAVSAIVAIVAVVLVVRNSNDGSPGSTGSPFSPALPAAMAEAVNAADRQAGSATHPSGAVYIGQQQCVGCHKEQAEKMAQVRMSRAIDRLTNSVDVPDAIKNPSCLGCHVTGFGRARAPGVTAADMVNVQCEACHGPGSEYIQLMKKGYKAADPALSKKAAELGLIAKPDKQVCLNCHHDEPGQAPWNYQEHREFIRHWDGP